MRFSSITASIALAAAGLGFLAPGGANAGTPEEEIVLRMQQRQPEIVELKVRRLIRETSDGMLEAIAGARALKADEKLEMLKENEDRRELYRIIGAKASPKMSAADVGKLRARLRPAAPL